MAGIQRGTMSVRMEYDQNGRIISQIFADGKSWSYTYLEKVGKVQVLCLPFCVLHVDFFLLTLQSDFFIAGSSGCTTLAERSGEI